MTMTFDAPPREAERPGQSKPAQIGATPRRGLIDTVDVTVEAYLGTRKITIGELNALEPGAIVALDAALNASIELRVNGTAIASGELVAVGDKFAVRITAVAP